MSTPIYPTKLDVCGCCEVPPSLPRHYNRPGQPSIAYRLGTHATFLRYMLARLHLETVSAARTPLKALTTRSTDDPAIALLDAWATIADVLTFYQERIANEGYLRTATERRSILELARTIGYELSPGVAAGTAFTFTVEDASGAPTEAIVPKGTKVQSTPAPGKMPQTFETSVEIVAKAEWNALKPALTEAQNLIVDSGGLKVRRLDGSESETRRIYVAGTGTNLKPGDLLLLVFNRQHMTATIQSVVTEEKMNRTRIELEERTKKTPGFTTSTHAAAPVAASASYMITDYAVPTTLGLSEATVKENVFGRIWSQSDLNAFLSDKCWVINDFMKIAVVASTFLSRPPDEGVFAFRERVGFFGHNAPYYYSLPDELREKTFLYPWDGEGDWEIWKDPLTNENYSPANIYFERTVPGIVKSSWVVFKSSDPLETKVYRVVGVSEASLTGFALSGKATGLELTEDLYGKHEPLTPQDIGTQPRFAVRKTTAFVQSERLGLAEIPIDEPVRGSSVILERLIMSLKAGQYLVLTGEEKVSEREDAPGVKRSELVVLREMTHMDSHTTLHFEKNLKHTYIRKTVALGANIVDATHGDTVVEVLGSGDSAQANQRFELKRPPLTYVSSPTSTGSASTLKVRVNGALWQELSSLYTADARSESYMVRIDDDGKPTLVFGDGEKGARLPTGTQNVVATYRTGIGLDGEVKAGSLNILQTKPLGIREVTNPMDASGAGARENSDQARVNAPLKILTLDRIVSLRDFEDFTRAFAGIGKAQAVALWEGETRLVHITIAAADGDQLNPDDQTYVNLHKAIDAARDPAQQIRIGSYQRVLFNLEARIAVNPRYIEANVLTDVKTALKDAFSFQNRGFGQPVTEAEIVTTIQKVAGVVAAVVDRLHRAGDPLGALKRSILPAATARQEYGEIRPAELLLLNSDALKLTVMEEGL